MSIIKIFCLVVLTTLLVLFVVRIIKEAVKFLYNIAPIVVPLLFLVLYLYVTDDLQNLRKEVHNAGYNQELKNTGGGG